MIIDKKLITQIHQEKIKNGLQDENLIENYLYINGYKVLFISRYRWKIYHIYASSACHFDALKHEQTFDLLYWTESLSEAISKWQSYIIRTFSQRGADN